ncbi:glycosyltransferase family 2 protein [candidate division KSB1 bacterium]|nr:MAG: glycosyltransferase family 2 protein [candidate division KSB1 bacterium]
MTSPLIPQCVFWLPLLMFVHSYLLYPFSLLLFPRRFKRIDGRPAQTGYRVAVLIPAFNEESIIRDKVANTLEIRYPQGLLEVLVGSDGSTDGTAELVRSFTDRRVRLIELDRRAGKAAVINRLSRETDADILVMTDANALFAPDSMEFLLPYFQDPAVGAVSGAKMVRVPGCARNLAMETSYSDFENGIKTLESEIGGMSGCRGAIMAVRRRDFPGFPPGTVNEDLVLGILMAASGMRIVFEPKARVFEESAAKMADEFKRRVRIGAGNFHAMAAHRAKFFKFSPIILYSMISHKVMRWLLPIAALAAVPASLWLLDSLFYRGMMALLCAMTAVAVTGWVSEKFRRNLPIASAVYHFAAMNAALLCGLFVLLAGKNVSAWERTER